MTLLIQIKPTTCDIFLIWKINIQAGNLISDPEFKNQELNPSRFKNPGSSEARNTMQDRLWFISLFTTSWILQGWPVKPNLSCQIQTGE